jgi:hypothetical protein
MEVGGLSDAATRHKETRHREETAWGTGTETQGTDRHKAKAQRHKAQGAMHKTQQPYSTLHRHKTQDTRHRG